MVPVNSDSEEENEEAREDEGVEGSSPVRSIDSQRLSQEDDEEKKDAFPDDTPGVHGQSRADPLQEKRPKKKKPLGELITVKLRNGDK